MAAAPLQKERETFDELEAKVTDVAWLSDVLGGTRGKVVGAELEDLSGAGGLSGARLSRLRVRYDGDGGPASCVLKARRDDLCKSFGLAREALFFREHAGGLVEQGLAPRVYHSHGSMEAGEKWILMEDLSEAVQSGYYFGAHSPLNWGKDLSALTATTPSTIEDVLRLSFRFAARFHARFWCASEMRDRQWVRGSDWWRGENRADFEAAEARWKETWAKAKERDEDIQWPSSVTAVLDAACAKLGWEAYSQDIAEATDGACWTLIHGDFHPANLMLRGSELVAVDFESVGIGRGPEDLGQYMISHLEPALREKLERQAVQDYYDTLVSARPEIGRALSMESCWRHYIRGGIKRWAFLLPLLATMGLPAPAVQYFLDQFDAFVRTHVTIGGKGGAIDEALVPMPGI